MSTLDFSPLLSSFSTLTLPSPRTGAYIATVPTTQPKTLILRDAQSLKITHAFKGEAKIQGVVWANTEDLIATWAGSEVRRMTQGQSAATKYARSHLDSTTEL